MPENKSRPPQDRPWESGWAPDTTRAPGTRRLWLAGALAVATIAACATSIALLDSRSEQGAPPSAVPTAVHTTVPGLISFASPSKAGTPKPGGTKDRPSPSPTTSEPSARETSATPSTAPTTSPAPERSSASPQLPSTTGTSLRSVNHPDRYWHLRDGSVGLDQIGSGPEQREDATFQRVKGLADPSCYSFLTSDGRYLRHRGFVLVANTNDGSSLFREDATFCPHYWSAWGTLSLESVNYPGRFLRHRDFQIRLDPYENSHQYHSDASFQMVAGLA